MDNEVFKTNPFVAIILPIIITVVILIIFFTTDVPPWILALLIVPVMFAVNGQKNKVIVGDGLLRYEKLFGAEETPLTNVSQIVMREVETIVNKEPDSHRNKDRDRHRSREAVNEERKVEKIFYVLDESGRTIFSFPANLIGFTNRRRFEEVVRSVNPNILFS